MLPRTTKRTLSVSEVALSHADIPSCKHQKERRASRPHLTEHSEAGDAEQTDRVHFERRVRHQRRVEPKTHLQPCDPERDTGTGA